MKVKVKGYMTIEATLVFPIILFVVLIMMGLSFYVYNRVIVKECIYEALVNCENKSEIKESIENHLGKSGVSLEIINVEVEEGLLKNSAKVDAKVNLLWIKSIDMSIHVEESMSRWHTVKNMRLMSLGRSILNQEDKFKNELE